MGRRLNLRSGSTRIGGGTPLQALTAGSGFYAGMQMRLRIYQVKTPQDAEDLVILDETIQGDDIQPNQPILFSVSFTPVRYMVPLMAEMSLQKRSTANLTFTHDAVLSLRMRKGK